MTVSNVNPASGETLTPTASFSFEVTDPYTSLLVRVTTNGGVLEAAYDDAVSPGYTVTIVDLGATHQVTVARDAGWDDDPMTVHVTESGTTASTWTYDVFPTAVYPEGMRPYNDSADGDSTGVVTFEGRSGNVNSAVGDYAASEVTNDSTVTGATVKDALDTLDAEVGAIVVPVDSVHGRTGAVVSAKDDYNAGEVTVATLGTVDLDTVQEVIDHTLGVGHIHGGDFGDNGDGTISVDAGSGFLRAVNGDTEPVYSMEWPTVNVLALTDNAINFIYVEYNAGTPQVAVSTTRPTDLNTNLLLWSVYRAGTFLHQTPNRYDESNLAREVNRRLYNVDGTTHSTGCAISETGTLNFALTAGTFYLGLNVAEWAAEDTSVASTFLNFYRDGVGGWTIVPGVATIDNLQYDDGSGTLAALSANRYGVHWVYVSPHDQDIYVLYGEGDYTRSLAESATTPAALPPHIDYWHGVLAGKLIVRQGITTFHSVESAFTKLFLSGGVHDHGDLTGLADDDHTQYSLVDGTRAFTGPIEVDSAVAAITLGERSTPGTPAAGKAILYAKTDGLMYSRDDAGVETLMSSGPAVTDHGVLSGLADDDHTQYSRADGTRDLDGLLLVERPDHVNTPGTGKGEIWLDDYVTKPRLRFTDEAGADKYIPTAQSIANTAILVWSGVTGELQNTSTFTYSAGRLWLNTAGGSLIMNESASAAHSPGAGQGQYWVKTGIPNRAMFTDDALNENELAYSSEVAAIPVGDVVGPASAVDNRLALFDGITGKLIKVGTAEHADVIVNSAHTAGNGADHANVALNDTHRTGDGSDHADVATNTSDILDRVVGPGSSSDTELVTYFGATGKVIQTTGGFIRAGTTGALFLGYGGTDTLLGIQERNVPPVNSVGYGKFWVKDDIPTTPWFTDDGTGDKQLAYVDADHGLLTGLGDDDHVRYVDVDGTRPQDAARITHRAARVNIPNTTECELWARTAGTYDEPMWTGSGGYDWTICRSFNPADRTIPFWTVSAAGDYCTVDANFTYNNSSDELIMGGLPAISLDDRATSPTPLAGAGKLYARSDYHEPTIMHNARDADGHDPTWLAPDGTETNLAWQERNLPLSMGATLWHHTAASINSPIGGTNKTTSDGNVSFIYDDVSNHWYNSWFDASLGDYILCDSVDGITWSSRKVLDTSTTSGDMSWVATTGTVCGAACDGLFYRSTDLTVANLAYKNSVPSATESTMLFWHGASNVWVHVGYSGSTSYIHTAPDSAGTMTWTQRWASSAYGLLVAGDIQRDPEGVSKSALTYPYRICLWSATNPAMVYTSTSTAFTWAVDAGGQPTTGLNVAHWCPALNTQYATAGSGGWMGINSAGTIWYCAQAGGGSWQAASYAGGTLWKSPTFQGWCNNAGTTSNTTCYSVHSVDNGSADAQHYSLVGYMRGGHSMLNDSDSLLNRGVYRWGNGVTVYDRYYDAQTIVGRYGPIRL